MDKDKFEALRRQFPTATMDVEEFVRDNPRLANQVPVEELNEKEFFDYYCRWNGLTSSWPDALWELTKVLHGEQKPSAAAVAGSSLAVTTLEWYRTRGALYVRNKTGKWILRVLGLPTSDGPLPGEPLIDVHVEKETTRVDVL